MAAMRMTLACLALAACGGGGARPPGTPASSASHLLGQEAPAIQRPALDGKPFDLREARGDVAVVVFLAKQCDPCTRVLPALEAVHADNKDVVMVGVSEDEQENDAREVVGQNHLSFPVVQDGARALAEAYRVTQLPVTFVLDGRGRVRWVGGPDRNDTELRAAIEATRP
jgi:cytochrome c biogenesis protein CcmG/thiol:disulfide interchange protein DsbE